MPDPIVPENKPIIEAKATETIWADNFNAMQNALIALIKEHDHASPQMTLKVTKQTGKDTKSEELYTCQIAPVMPYIDFCEKPAPDKWNNFTENRDYEYDDTFSFGNLFVNNPNIRIDDVFIVATDYEIKVPNQTSDTISLSFRFKDADKAELRKANGSIIRFRVGCMHYNVKVRKMLFIIKYNKK